LYIEFRGSLLTCQLPFPIKTRNLRFYPFHVDFPTKPRDTAENVPALTRVDDSIGFRIAENLLVGAAIKQALMLDGKQGF
jgi:hypothetical protein